MAQKSYESNGVSLSKKKISSGDKLKISYDGLLVQSGAQEVFLHIGYDEEWENKSLIPMENGKEGFFAEVDILDFKSFGICFKDNAENWDNNSGENYIFSITQKPVKKQKVIDIKASKKSSKLKI